MPRPKNPRHIRFSPGVYYYKPQGVPLRSLDEVILHSDELEALKLSDVDNLDQVSASKSMKISQPTYARILKSAHQKTSSAIINGKAIRIQKPLD